MRRSTRYTALTLSQVYNNLRSGDKAIFQGSLDV